MATASTPRLLHVHRRIEDVVTGDFNGDGLTDIGTLNDTSVSVLLGNGDGTFQPPLNTTITATYPEFMAARDFNRDGKADLAMTDLPPSRST